MKKINFEAYVDYLKYFCGVKDPRNLACQIFSENYPARRISFESERAKIEVEDCAYDPKTNRWIPTGHIEKIFWRTTIINF